MAIVVVCAVRKCVYVADMLVAMVCEVSFIESLVVRGQAESKIVCFVNVYAEDKSQQR